MKTNDPRDPLDRKIDELLAGQPIKAPRDFSARILQDLERPEQNRKSVKLPLLLRFALPAAAALALAFLGYSQLHRNNPRTPTQIAGHPSYTAPKPLSTRTAEADEALKHHEIQEILLLQEGLSGFAQIEAEELSSGDLLDTLDTLYSI